MRLPVAHSFAAMRLPRMVHPIAWWIWAIGLATATSRTTNPLLLTLILVVVGVVVAARRTEAPWARAFKYYLMLGLVVIAIRIGFRIILGAAVGATEHVLFTIPSIPLPGFMSGVELGGPVSAESVLSAAYDGFRLATLLCCIGAANTLANPKRAFRVLPAALYELGVTITVAVTVAPQLVESVQRVRRARKLRGDTTRGRRAVRAIAMPVLHDALDRSFRLAAAMDSRGYGRTGVVTPRVRRVTAALLLAGLVGLCMGTYSLLDTSTPRLLGLPALVLGVVLSAAGFVIGGRRVRRTQYRPDPWRFAEWSTAFTGVVVAAVVITVGRLDASVLNPSIYPLAWPTLPAVPAAAILFAVLPAFITPPPPIAASAPARPEPAVPVRQPVGERVIRFDQVTITYADAAQPTLHDVHFEVPAGELCVVIGATGSGKSTLLGAINGLVPHFTGGQLRGQVTVDGRDTRTHPPRELADVVGVVTQDPLAGCVTDTLEEELAYGMEQLAIPPDVMRKRVEETLDLLGLAELRNRALYALSAGQLQRVAIGAVLTAHPKVLVLDEPTSALDPTGAEEVLATIMRLVHDLGVTVMMAEHRLERVVQYADRVVYLPGDGTVQYGEPQALLARSDVAPPIVELGRLAGWDPLPLSIRDARRRATSLAADLAGLTPPPAVPQPLDPRPSMLRGRGIVVRYGSVAAVRNVDIELFAGEIAALMGRNGAGKSSLLWALQGSAPRHGGRVEVDRRDPADLPPQDARRLVGLVPHTPSDLLYLDSVAEELGRADAESGVDAGHTRATLDRLAPGIADDAHPRDLSEGQRLALVLAVQLAAGPRVMLLDEPTRGLDYRAKRELGLILRDLAAGGHAIAVSTHDVEFVAATAHRVVVMAEGEIVADGPTASVIVASPAFAPQISKILAPQAWLTVDQLLEAGAFVSTEVTQ